MASPGGYQVPDIKTTKTIGGVTLKSLVRGCALALALAIGHVGAIAQSGGKAPETEVKTEVLKASVVYRFDRGVGRGRVVKSQSGTDGYVKRTFELTRNEKGAIVKRTLIDTEKMAARPTIYSMGKQGYETSRGSFTRSVVKVMEATAYHPSAGLKNPTFKTASGLPAKYGVIAVDPRVIKLGTLVFVEGYGFAIAADTGGAIKGNIIDVCLPTHSEVRNWGRRKVKVHIFQERGFTRRR